MNKGIGLIEALVMIGAVSIVGVLLINWVHQHEVTHQNEIDTIVERMNELQLKYWQCEAASKGG